MTLTVRLLASFQISTDSKLVVDLSPPAGVGCLRRPPSPYDLQPPPGGDCCGRRRLTARRSTTCAQITRLRQVLPVTDQLIEISRLGLQAQQRGRSRRGALSICSPQAAALRAERPAAALDLCNTAIQYYTADLPPLSTTNG